MLILAIESSCDETSAAVLEEKSFFSRSKGINVLSNIVSTQIEFHKKYGGIVPEVAARKHIELIASVVKEAIDKSNVPLKKIDAVAATYGPGLVGSLIVGLCYAKALAWGLKKPFIGINHLEGHLYANMLSKDVKKVEFPFISLLVSGGHTMIILVKGHGEYEVLGQTRDDAAGEAFDKVARVLGLGYPGGPVIDKIAKEGIANIKFKKPMMEDSYGYDFSFSGIKTAVVNYVANKKEPLTEQEIKDVSASFQQTVVETLVEKLISAAKDKNIKTVSIAGGVSANSALREYFKKRCNEESITPIVPPFEFSTDNAAMIGAAAIFKFKKKEFSPLDLKPIASLKL